MPNESADDTPSQSTSSGGQATDSRPSKPPLPLERSRFGGSHFR